MPTLLKRSNGVYYAIVSDGHGHRRWVSTGKRIRSQALKVFAERSQTAPRSVHGKPIEQFFREFLDYGQNVYAPENLQVYRRAFHGFIRHIGNIKTDAVSQRHVDTLKSKRLGEVGPVTVNMELRTLRAAFYMANRWKLTAENPFKQVRLCPLEEQAPAYLSIQDFRLLLSCMNQPWLRDLIIVAAFTGMRRGELVQLRWSDVDLGKDVLTIRSHGKVRTKFGKMRVVPMNPQVREAILRRQEQSGCEYVFHRDCQAVDGRYLSRAFKRCIRRAHLSEQMHFHSLRHTFSSWLVQNTDTSLYQVQKLLGHSTIRITEMYSHLVPADLQKAVNKLPAL
jgi:integrase